MLSKRDYQSIKEYPTFQDISHLYMVFQVPFHGNNIDYRKDQHQIPRIFLTTEQINDANQEYGAHGFDCISMVSKQVMDKSDDTVSLSLWLGLYVLQVFQDSAICELLNVLTIIVILRSLLEHKIDHLLTLL